MDLWSAARVVGRHVGVLMLGLVLVAGVLLAVDAKLAPRYSATGTTVVMQQVDTTVNPLIHLTSSNELAASLTVTYAQSSAAKQSLQALGDTTDYTLTVDPTLPIITISATSTDPAIAVRTVADLTSVMNDALRAQQTELQTPTAGWISVFPVDTPTEAPPTTAKKKVLAITAVLGALVAVGLTFVAEAFTVMRRRRRTMPAQALPTGQRALDISAFAERPTLAASPPTAADKTEGSLLGSRPNGTLHLEHDVVVEPQASNAS